MKQISAPPVQILPLSRFESRRRSIIFNWASRIWHTGVGGFEVHPVELNHNRDFKPKPTSLFEYRETFEFQNITETSELQAWVMVLSIKDFVFSHEVVQEKLFLWPILFLPHLLQNMKKPLYLRSLILFFVSGPQQKCPE